MPSGIQQGLALAKKLYFEATSQKTVNLRHIIFKVVFLQRSTSVPWRVSRSEILGGFSFTFCSSMSSVVKKILFQLKMQQQDWTCIQRTMIVHQLTEKTLTLTLPYLCSQGLFQMIGKYGKMAQKCQHQGILMCAFSCLPAFVPHHLLLILFSGTYNKAKSSTVDSENPQEDGP